MIQTINQRISSKQVGASLIFFMMIIVLAVTAGLISYLNSGSVKNERERKTSAALAEAKAALIGYAIAYDDTHAGEVYGHLPCPDLSPASPGEGSQTSCGATNVSVLGKFPWKTLDTEVVRDGYGECLWYAVSGRYKNNPKISDLNPITLGQFLVRASNGTNLADNADPAVAIIFAPSYPLGGQNRNPVVDARACGGNYTPSNYLDTDIVSGINNAFISAIAEENSTFVIAADSTHTLSEQDSFNDKLMIITRKDIFGAYCQKYARKLTKLIFENSNCGNTEEEPVVVETECLSSAENLQNYCQPPSCKEAATKLVGVECLEDMDVPECQEALEDLRGCYAV